MKKVLLSLILILTTFSLYAQTWTAQTSPITTDLNGLSVVDANIVWACGPTGGVVRTTNGGTTWTLANTGLTGNDLYTIAAVSDQIAIAGAGDGGMWRTTNGGTSWTFQLLTPAPQFMDVVYMFDANNGFALSDPTAAAGLWLYYITTNGGVNWTAGANRPPNAAGEAGWNGSFFASDTGHIWWGTNASKIWHGGFRGAFASGSTTNPNSFCMAFNDNSTGVAAMVTAGNVSGPMVSTVNGGTTWTATGFTPTGLAFCMHSVPFSGYMWMGTATNIMMSSNSGSSWSSQLTSANAIYAVRMYSYNLGWATTATGKIYKYTGNVTGVGNNNNGIPTSFSLEQNYPNPFNPTTDIRYNLPKASNVTLKLYDILGNEVMTVVNGFKDAGSYTAEVNASNLSSGVYFYTIKAGDFTASKKMSLIK